MLSDLLLSGGRGFAVWVAIGNSYSTEVLSSAGYDALVFDTQHGGITWDNLGALIQAADLGRAESLVRIGGVDPAQIMRALDLGAAGAIVPMINTVEEARRAAAAMTFPPKGNRSFGPVRNYYGSSATPRKLLCFAMIETPEGIDNMDAIAAVDGIDGLFVGPVDLGLALGLGVVMTPHDRVLAAIDDIVRACRHHGKISACASFNADYSRALLQHDVQLIVQGSDMGLIRRGMTDDVRAFRALAEEFPGRPG